MVRPGENDALAWLKTVEQWLKRMAEEGSFYGPHVIAAPAGERREMLASDRRYRSYGTLMFLLDYAHENIEVWPEDVYELVAMILPFVDSVDSPVPMYRDRVRGTAWKERGNTLFSRDIGEAKNAAGNACHIFNQHAGLAEDLAKAELLRAKIARELGNTGYALWLARKSARTFHEFGDARYYNIARTIEAWIFFGLKQFRAAYDIVCDLVEKAERAGDELALGYALHFAGACARELGDLTSARSLRGRALEHLERVKAPPGEMPRIRWEHALALAAEGLVGEAIFELYKVRSELLRYGKIISAATAGLDIVRLRFERGEDVTTTASELVTTFAEAGLTPNAMEALAYVRARAQAQALTVRQITVARDFFKVLEREPARVFLPPPGDSWEGR
ncbi:MAG TPA: hypothetical protein VII75_01155 [Thermoanaerobaculia bacterium]|nr:hypothetical protein [Thermoanaerobaculia bacterium]